MKKLPLLLCVLLLPACVTDPVTGKKSLDPQIRNAIIDTARAAVSGLAAGAATSGKLDWAAAAQGALANVYSVQSVAAIDKAVGYAKLGSFAPAVTTAVNTVIATAQNNGLDTKSAILIGTTALDTALQAAKAP